MHPGAVVVRAGDGVQLALRRIPASRTAPAGAPPVLVLHATLSSSRQLLALGEALADRGPVLLLDRRGSGDSRLAVPMPMPIARHVADIEDALDREGIGRAVVVGHSFGGVVALEAAARLPRRVQAVVAWEPPYVAASPDRIRSRLAAVADATLLAGTEHGPAGAAATFMRAVSGEAGWAATPPRTRAALEAEGGGAIVDVRMDGLDPAGLAHIEAPVTILVGGRSEPFYSAIADELAARIPGARVVRVDGMRHPAPITDPEPVAAATLAALGAARVPTRSQESLP